MKNLILKITVFLSLLLIFGGISLAGLGLEFFVLIIIALMVWIWWKGITYIWKEKQHESKEEE